MRNVFLVEPLTLVLESINFCMAQCTNADDFYTEGHVLVQTDATFPVSVEMIREP